MVCGKYKVKLVWTKDVYKGQTARVLVQDPIQEEWVFLLGKQHFKNHGVLRKIKKCKYDLLQRDENAQLSLNTVLLNFLV